MRAILLNTLMDIGCDGDGDCAECPLAQMGCKGAYRDE